MLGIPTDTEDAFLLCRPHYSEVYKQVHAAVSCACCGAKPKHGKPFERHSPNAQVVSDHLNN